MKKIPSILDTPKSLGAGATYRYKKALEKKFTFKDRFGDVYHLFNRLNDTTIEVPRNCAPLGGDDCVVSNSCPKYKWSNNFVPRSDEQTRVVEESVAILESRGVRGGHILQAPTGFGKTWCGAAIIQSMGVRTCVITTKEDLSKEWVTALATTLGISEDKVGIWAGDKVPEAHHEVVVAMVQSVCKGYDRYPEELYKSFGFVVVDEVQRMGADKFSQAMWHFPGVYRIGLSATPYRKDGKEIVFHAHIGEIEVITKEVNRIPKVIMYDTKWEVPEVWQFDPDVGKSVFGPLKVEWGRVTTMVKHLMADKHRTSIVVNFLKSCHKKGRSVVVMSDTVEYLQVIHAACIEAGITDTYENFGYYCGLSAPVYEKATEGRKINKEAQREAAKVAVICFATYKMCGEGTNVPWWDTEVLLTPKADVTQPVGRILRDWPDKFESLVLDMCDYAHFVTRTFAGSRKKWYIKIGAKIVDM